MARTITSRFALTRYRARIFAMRLADVRPGWLEFIGLMLGVVGAWSVLRGALAFVAGGSSTLRSAGALVGALVLFAAAMWFSITRKPNRLFVAAAASEERTELFRKVLMAGMKNRVAYDSLADLYRPLVGGVAERLGRPAVMPSDRDGNECLVITVPALPTDHIAELLTAPLVARDDEWERRTSGFAPERQQYIEAMRRSARHHSAFDDEAGYNVILERVEHHDGGLAIAASCATYGQIVRTSDSLVNEFALFGYLSGRSAFRRRRSALTLDADALMRVLPWRRAAHEWNDPADVLIAPTGRASGIGVSVAVVDRSGPAPVAFAARRSTKVGTYPDVAHVIPSGMVNLHSNPASVSAFEMSNLPATTMLAEFLEECFDEAQLSGHASIDFAGEVRRVLEQRGLSGLRPKFTGLAVDLLNLRTEICGVLDLGDLPDAARQFTLSWEYSHADPIMRCELAQGAAAVAAVDFVQSGIGCLELGRRWLVDSGGRA